MDFGIFNIMQQRDVNKSVKQIYDEAAEQTIVAEQLGFDKAWYAEHHFSNYSLCPSPLMMCAHMAGRTKKIHLGSGVVVAPLYNPARLLAEIGMVDTMSNGRFELGVGNGYQGYEFDRFGVDLKDAGRMTSEILDMLALGLAEDAFEYNGEYFKQPRSSINVKPLKKKMPPLWYAGGHPEHLKKIAQGDHTAFITGVLGGVSRMKAARENFEKIAASVGKDPSKVKVAVSRLAFPTKSKKDAAHYIDCARYQQRLAVSLKTRNEQVHNHYMVQEVPFAEELDLESIERNLPVGDVDSVIEKVVRTVRELKPVHFMIQTQVGDMEHSKSLEAMELWMTEVVPAVMRELTPGQGLTREAA
jgi:alkanesulfonate monooxygenase SsuD/methylene tetrahydromethanopterin reductase-like flavin-dependent oxidoreductase (luciferase family)